MLKKTEEYFNRLLESSAKKLLVLQEYYKILLKQRTIASIDTKEYQITKDISGQIFSSINILDEEFNTYFNNLKRHLNLQTLDDYQANPNPKLLELKTIISDILALTQEIQQLEIECHRNLQQHRQAIGNEVKQLQNRRQNNNAYQNKVNQIVTASRLDETK